ncbi:MAG TPA: phytoene/squalene synthase family protein, partial [Fibrobacter sp.]|nr:phytoene/squalene synthase family protein [Fibrobacter sp.]
DLKEDLNDLGRVYFPELRQQGFNVESKRIIEASIQKDFDDAWVGITKLPGRSKLAVALAYFYYRNLFLKIKKMSPQVVLSKRIRISNFSKQLIVLKVALMYKIKVF